MKNKTKYLRRNKTPIFEYDQTNPENKQSALEHNHRWIDKENMACMNYSMQT